MKEKIPIGLLPYAQAMFLSRFLRNDLDDYPIINNILLRNKIMSYDTFESFIKVFIKKTMNFFIKQLDENNNVTIGINVFVEDLIGFRGKTFKHYWFKFDSQTIKDLYDGDLNGLVTLFHETFHGIADIWIKSGIVDPHTMKIIKEIIIRETESKYNDDKDFYYKTNYKHIAGEIYAQQSAVNMVEFLLKNFNLNPPEGFIEKQRNRFDLDFSNDNRDVFIDGEKKVMSVDEIFSEVIVDHPELLEEYSQLNLEYIKDGDKVRKKTKKELKDTLDTLEKKDAILYVESLLNKNYS